MSSGSLEGGTLLNASHGGYVSVGGERQKAPAYCVMPVLVKEPQVIEIVLEPSTMALLSLPSFTGPLSVPSQCSQGVHKSLRQFLCLSFP